MNAMISPDLAAALARVAELEEEAVRASKAAAKREREHLSNSDELFRQLSALKQEIAEGNEIDRFNQKYTDGLEEALEELEVEVVAERAAAMEADQIRADAEREVADLTKEVEGLVKEKEELEKRQEERDEEVYHDLAVAGDLLRDYLAASFNSTRLPRELQTLVDHLDVRW